MLSKEYCYIKEEILKLVETEFPGNITVAAYDGVSVKYDGTNAVIGCGSKVQFARGVFLLAQNFQNGAFQITQKPNFDLLCSMLDVSRNGVFTMDAIQYWVTCTAALGYTHFYMYMEDMYALEDYPRLGYMRGRYSKEDLKQLNQICQSFGVEVIPCVQSLGHMAQYLQWKEALPIKDTESCLLVDEPETYAFLDKAFALMRECFPASKLINIALDETFDLGTGKFMKLHGYEPRSSIFQRHAAKVFALCDKYGFRPRMAGDMFFRMKGSGAYYDPNVVLTPEDAKDIPEEMLIGYWDYYHTDKETYLHYIQQHRNLGRELILCGAVWTWEGFVEDTVFTLQTSVPFLQAAIESGEKTFFAYTFGDQGSESNFIRSIGSFAIFSEYCYRGLACTQEDIFAASEFLTKMPYKHKIEIGKIHSDYHHDYRFAVKLMCGDVFYNLVNIHYDYDKVLADLCEAEKKTAEYTALNDRYYDYYQYCHYVASLTRQKLELINKIRSAYESGDKAYLRLAAEEKLPEFIKGMTEFIEVYKKEWLKHKKSNGIEVVLLRLASAREQAFFRSQQLTSYLNGEIDEISELEEKLIEDEGKTYESRLFTTSTWKI